MQAEVRAQVELVRRFNRFYKRRIGVLEEGLLASPFTLTQARILFELGTRQTTTAGELIDTLGLDPGYLGRILQSFVQSRPCRLGSASACSAPCKHCRRH